MSREFFLNCKQQSNQYPLYTAKVTRIHPNGQSDPETASGTGFSFSDVVNGDKFRIEAEGYKTTTVTVTQIGNLGLLTVYLHRQGEDTNTITGHVYRHAQAGGQNFYPGWAVEELRTRDSDPAQPNETDSIYELDVDDSGNASLVFTHAGAPTVQLDVAVSGGKGAQMNVAIDDWGGDGGGIPPQNH